MTIEENGSEITRTLVETPNRVATTARLFGYDFPQQIEPYVYTVAREIAPEYNGGYWLFYTLSNGGFYLAPDLDEIFQASCAMNFYKGELSADALGIVACLTAYSHLSFGKPEAFARACAFQFHRLRAYAGYHSEAGHIFAAID